MLAAMANPADGGMEEIGHDDLGRLRSVLERSRELGLLGPGDVDRHVEHALAWAPLVPGSGRILDLGSGGGVPGLPLAMARPQCTFLLLDGSRTRIEVLREAVATLGLAGRVDVRADRAEVAGRDADLRGTFDVVVARSFGRPAVTAECAAPFLRVGGALLVSEPPTEPGEEGARWDAEGLLQLGLRLRSLHRQEGATIVELRQASPCPAEYPRPNGRPAKRPLF